MSHDEQALFSAVDNLLERVAQDPLPPPAERRRLREAAGLSQEQIAQALQTRRESVGNWESGKTDPRPPKRAAYARLLDGLAARYPRPETDPAAPAPAAPDPAVPSAAPRTSATEARAQMPAPAPQPVPAVPDQSVPKTPPAPTSRRPGPKRPVRRPVQVAADKRFAHGPLAVVDAADGQVSAHCVGGLVLEVSAETLPELVEWTLAEAQLGQPRLHACGKDADPLLVLTAAACERYGLPTQLTDAERLTGRLPEDHPILRELRDADWKLTRRGFGPWARIYRPAAGRERQCVQLCLPSWQALETRTWGPAAQLPPADLARLLGTYATRVMTPRGSTAVTGLELLTATNPPTRAGAPGADGRRHSEHRPGSLGTEPLDCAPCEAPDGHPLLADLPRFHQRGPAEMLLEEAYDWARPLTDEECMKPYLVGIDVNLAFGAAANGALVGLAGPPEHVLRPDFDPTLPGAWLVDLSHIDLAHVLVGKEWRHLDGDLLPSPFTPTGERPTGPAWYATPTVAYAVELGYDVVPIEAWVRQEKGKALDGWYKRLRDAYVLTMGDLGVAEKLPPAAFLAAMEGHKDRDAEMATVLDAVKSTVKGGIGKLRERPRGGGWRPGRPWPALSRPTWRPDIRAVVISRARTNMHRKMLNLAAATGRYPVAVLSDCAVYAAAGPSPLDVLPYDTDGRTVPGSFRLGVSPGMVKHEGTQSVLWGEGVHEQLGTAGGKVANLARYIKTGETTAADSGE
ncbi:telomere-associated protein Tap [Streptomyces sp. NPDC059740]|uniref:telomere-associated protein Tap n=1 Tax=Streptomyces sp. NPDC059740 TaxID=3346926 RepID=UPI003665E274